MGDPPNNAGPMPMVKTPANMVESILAKLDINRAVEADLPSVILRDNERVAGLEHLMEAPNRIRRSVSMSSWESFLDYLDKMKNDTTAVYIEQSKVVAIIDHPAPGAPEWESHRVEFALVPTAAAKAWQAHVTSDGSRATSQQQFALLLERRSLDVINPSAATMLEIATTLEAKPNIAWKSSIRLQDGARQFLYEETTNATAGTKGQLTIPEGFTIRVPLFEDVPDVTLGIRLRFRLNGGELSFFLEWTAWDEAVKQTRSAMQGQVEEHDVDAFQGAAAAFYNN